ncbi:MAG: galactokinase [Anaerolineae bacterium]|jgi:galactokinase|nr:galactokinase [Anaerolineae bacterium]
MTDLRLTVHRAFEQHFGEPPAFIARAPGRVNLIGEHTDYNDGFVFPMAIDRETLIAFRPRPDRTVSVHLLDFDQHVTFSLENLTRVDSSPVEYLKGVAAVLQSEDYTLSGWEGVIAGNVPIGAGLSSSASLEMAAIRAFEQVSGFIWDAPRMAKLGQRVENEWLGLKTGIMDQMISAAGQTGHAVLIDCRTLDLKPAPLPQGTVVVVMDTSTRRGLVHSKYNERRQQCEAAAAHFGIAVLRDISVEAFDARAHELDDLTRRRARHVVTENARTLAAYDAMQQGDPRILGALMDASHESLRDDFEVSTDALNAIVTAAQRHPACYGARMTGAGFGGCAVALVMANQAESFVQFVTGTYQHTTGLQAALYVCHASEGASLSSLFA